MGPIELSEGVDRNTPLLEGLWRGTALHLWQTTVVLVARSNPTDQYIAQTPDFFFGRSPEHARIDANNLLIVADHIKCAAFELPFTTDGEAFGRFDAKHTEEVLGWLASHRLLFRGGERWRCALGFGHAVPRLRRGYRSPRGSRRR